jgi:hypothetical protein
LRLDHAPNQCFSIIAICASDAMHSNLKEVGLRANVPYLQHGWHVGDQRGFFARYANRL